MPLMADVWMAQLPGRRGTSPDDLEDARVRAARCTVDGMTGSAEAAPPQQIRRKGSWRLDEMLNFEPCVEQGIQVGGQLAVGCAHPDAGAVGTVVRRDPPAFAVVACP